MIINNENFQEIQGGGDTSIKYVNTSKGAIKIASSDISAPIAEPTPKELMKMKMV